MLSVTKINNINYKSTVNFLGSTKKITDTDDAQKAYMDMNRSLTHSFVDGDISLGTLLKEKVSNFFDIACNVDPTIAIKAKMIEDSLKKQAARKLAQNIISDGVQFHYDFVA